MKPLTKSIIFVIERELEEENHEFILDIEKYITEEENLG